MENQFFVDSEHLSQAALDKKHRLETDPSSRKNHMEYLPGMEIIESDISGLKEQLINCFENTSPYDFLKAKYGGSKPTTKDINLIEGLLVNQELNPGVVNVLVDYVLKIKPLPVQRFLFLY